MKADYPRTRSRGNYTLPATLATQTDIKNQPSQFTYDHTSYTGIAVQDFMHDVVNPGYKLRILKGEVFNNPMSKYERRASEADGVLEVTKTAPPNPGEAYKTRVTGPVTQYALSLGGYTFGSLATNADSLSTAMQKAIAEMDSSTFALLEDVAEIRKTISQLHNPLREAEQLLRTFKSEYYSRRKRGWPHAKALADTYLAYKYGLKPVWKGLNDVFTQVTSPKFSGERRVARGSDSADLELDELVTKTASIAKMSHILRKSRKDSAGILYLVKNPVDTTLEALGIRAKDIPSTAWNLVGYSFMVDRFLDIQSMIKGLMNLADPGIKILAAWTVSEETEISQFQLIQGGAVASGWTRTAFYAAPYYETIVSKTRVPWEPTVADTLPTLKNGFKDMATLIDLAAMCTQHMHLGSFDTK